MPDTEFIEVQGENTVLEVSADDVVLTQQETFVILTEGIQGPPGRPGDAGAASVQFPTSAAIGGHRIVRLQAGVLVYADKDDVNFPHAPLGFTLSATDAGELASVQTAGLMTEPSWAWTPDQPIFVGANGVPTQVAPDSGYSLIVAIATSPTQIFIGAKSPIVLQE